MSIKTIEAHKVKQSQIISLLSKLSELVERGNDFGLNLPKDSKRKIELAINKTEDQLKVALIGGFSEGKTSIAAAWLGRIDSSSMKISELESSNEIKEYKIDDCILIDTPGLYGYKEKQISEREIQRYKDITKKYISEAHILLYVMNPSNPIKESHKDDLLWLFRDLNLLSRTVFVLSRFDEVADLEDENEYQEKLSIKRESIKGRLRDLLNLNDDEVSSLYIVGISANPFDEGVEYWLENRDEFLTLSHIEALQQATTNIVKQNGSLEKIAQETQKTILNDILIKELPKIESEYEKITEKFNELNDFKNNIASDFNDLSEKIKKAKRKINERVSSYIADLIMQLESLEMDDAGAFIQAYIGNNYNLVINNLDAIFQEESDGANIFLNEIMRNIDGKIESINREMDKLVKDGVTYIVKNVKINNTMVIATRDGIKNVAKMVGVDLSKLLKLKPYQAINIAKVANGIFAVLGLAIDLWSKWDEREKQIEFEKAMKNISNDIASIRDETLEQIKSDDFINNFFPAHIEFEKILKEIDAQTVVQEKYQQDFSKWKNEIEIIDAEFKEIN